MWKPLEEALFEEGYEVSVPLRGLDMWKHFSPVTINKELMRFSPLAGIRYVETPAPTMRKIYLARQWFQSPCGD